MLVDQYGNPLVREQPRRTRSRGSLHARYDAAQDTSENRNHWHWADHMSAAAANSIQVRRKLRSRARYECLEANSFLKGMCLTLANDTIQTGPSLQVTIGNRVVGAFIEREWRKWCRAVGLAEKLRTARLSKIVDGEVFILKTTNRRLRTPVQLDVKLIEADQISTPGLVEGMPNQCDGIEFDKFGAPINYHMLKGHPGDLWAVGAWQKDDVSPDDLIHMYRVERPGQVRGIPEVTPALPLCAFLRRLTLATVAAAETAANFSAIVETAATSFDDDDYGADDPEPFSTVDIERNMMTSLPRGWKMNQFKPEQPTTTYEMFRNALLNEIARCIHMPANKARADSSGYNYSSGRLDHQTYYVAIDIERTQWEINAMDRIFEWWLDEALMLTNYIMLDGPFDEISHEWRWNPNTDNDPKDAIEAAVAAIEAGLMTEEQYLHSQNIDPEQHYQQLLRQAAKRRQIAMMGGVLGNADIPVSQPTMSESSQPTQAAAPAGPAPTGEFGNISRQQLKRNLKAIDDATEKLSTGEWTETKARAFLSSVGLSQQMIDAFLLEELDKEEPVTV